MLLPLLLLSQAANLHSPPPIVIDLLPKACGDAAAQGDEVVVCGRRDEADRYRIGQLPSKPSDIPAAQLDIAGAKLAAETERGEVGGMPTNRVMLKLKVKF